MAVQILTCQQPSQVSYNELHEPAGQKEVNFFKHSAEIMWEITLLVVWWPIAAELIAILMPMGKKRKPQKTYPQLNSNFQLAPFSLGLWSVYYQNADLQVENIQSNEYVCIRWSPQEVSPNEVLTLMSPTWQLINSQNTLSCLRWTGLKEALPRWKSLFKILWRVHRRKDILKRELKATQVKGEMWKTVVKKPELFWVDREIPGFKLRHPSLHTISCCTLDRLGGFVLILIL